MKYRIVIHYLSQDTSEHRTQIIDTMNHLPFDLLEAKRVAHNTVERGFTIDVEDEDVHTIIPAHRVTGVAIEPLEKKAENE